MLAVPRSMARSLPKGARSRKILSSRIAFTMPRPTTNAVDASRPNLQSSSRISREPVLSAEAQDHKLCRGSGACRPPVLIWMIQVGEMVYSDCVVHCRASDLAAYCAGLKRIESSNSLLLTFSLATRRFPAEIILVLGSVANCDRGVRVL